MSDITIAFLGIGLMGLPMSKNLLKEGYKIRVWNRTVAKAKALEAAGAQAFDSPSEAVVGADIIITMLETGPVVHDVLIEQGTYKAIKQDALVIDMSSIPPQMARDHYAFLKEAGISHLDAPVSGGTVGAEQAKLAIMVGGDKSAYSWAQPLFEALGSPTYIGPAGAGQLAKCANQAIVGITIGAVSEALLLAAQGGADPVAVRKALMGGFASSRILDLHGQRMLDRNFMPGATARVQLKDLNTILDEAENHNLTLPLSAAVKDEYVSLVERGLDGVDHSGLLLELEETNKPARLGDGETLIP